MYKMTIHARIIYTMCHKIALSTSHLTKIAHAVVLAAIGITSMDLGDRLDDSQSLELPSGSDRMELTSELLQLLGQCSSGCRRQSASDVRVVR